MLIPNHSVFSYIIPSVYPGIYLFIFWTSFGLFSQSRNYAIVVLPDLAKGDGESGVWIDEYNYQNKDKK